jgi:hypothetical protein
VRKFEFLTDEGRLSSLGIVELERVVCVGLVLESHLVEGRFGREKRYDLAPHTAHSALRIRFCVCLSFISEHIIRERHDEHTLRVHSCASFVFACGLL